jgi:hypothetical protein
VEHSRSYHVWRSEVAHDEIVFALPDNLGNLLSDTLDTHLRVLVVCRHLRRGNHMALLVLELLLNASVEEESDVRILLGL